MGNIEEIMWMINNLLEEVKVNNAADKKICEDIEMARKQLWENYKLNYLVFNPQVAKEFEGFDKEKTKDNIKQMKQERKSIKENGKQLKKEIKNLRKDLK